MLFIILFEMSLMLLELIKIFFLHLVNNIIIIVTVLILSNKLILFLVIVDIVEFMLVELSWMVETSGVVVAAKLVLTLLVEEISIWIVET
jgi:hypothetical protein